MKKPDLAIVFGKKGGEEAEAEEAEEMSEEEGSEDSEMDAAVDAAIDDLFAAKDPEARREAFKTAVNLCKEGSY